MAVLITLFAALLYCCPVFAFWPYAQPNLYPDIPASGPKANPPYMVDNQHNYFHEAPDKGKQNGPIWPYSGSFENYMVNLKAGHVIRGGHDSNSTASSSSVDHSNATTKHATGSNILETRASSYWLPSLAPEGAAPLATQSGYQFFRNVVTDFGADNTGATDTSEALNAAITAISSSVTTGGRCGLECGNTFTMGAIVYFPAGTYKICSPVIQLYYTQFIGDATNPPTILGCSTFTGIALFDTDPYIPGGGGAEWYINQNQFFRQIRNFIFDLTQMPDSTDDNGQPLSPTGIHWQVAQATSLQNLVFNMPTTADTTTVGIFMENGSGGFVSDLTFNGGSIGWRAGSQQYTARQLSFNGCLTAVQMVWDWGFVWQGVQITGGAIAFNISGNGGDTGQGTGSVSIVDCSISNVPVAVLTNAETNAPGVVLDNLFVSNVAYIVQVSGGSTLLAGTSGQDTVFLWANGNRYNGSVSSHQTGSVEAPQKPTSLLTRSNALYVRSRPQYETIDAGSFLIATKDGGCANDGTGDQAGCINTFLENANAAGQIAYFPAGIYQVGSTVFVPTGSRIQGASWSQIQGAGIFFSDLNNPQVMVKVGNQGEVGSLEIVEMLFSVKGPTSGIILMEWNVAASEQGAAGMWDSHFRVGGAEGSELDEPTCPKFGFNDQCIAASLMFHVTSQASGYFENVWAWVADHDNDMNMYDEFDPTANQVSIYGARGMLIESQGPSWFYGTGSEHSVLYNYQLNNAKNIYMGHIQTETPYYQPNPVAPQPFDAQIPFPGDPSFVNCDPNSQSCAAAWGLRVVDSSNVTIHGAGLYSFFQDFYQDCLTTENCQDKILEVTGSTGIVIFNLFTIATVQIAVGIDNTVIYQNASQSGFTTEVSVWIPLPGADNIDIIYVGTEVWSASSSTVTGSPPCVLVLPTSSLSTLSTIVPGNYTTSVEYGNIGPTSLPNGEVITVFLTTITTLTLTIPDITIGAIPFSNVNITSGDTSGGFIATPSVPIPNVIVTLPDGNGGSTARTLSLPPWPEITNGPPDQDGTVTNPWTSIASDGSVPSFSTTFHTQFTTTIAATAATVTTLTIPSTVSPLTIDCPPQSLIPFNTPLMTIATSCPVPTTFTFPFNCPTTKVVTFLSASEGVFTIDCTFTFNSPTATSAPASTTSTTTPLPVWATWPNFAILPVTTPVPSAQPTDVGVVIPCKLWFFDICIEFPSFNIQGWNIRAPPGIYPFPGPPPGIKWPPGFTLEGKLPPWPEITILPGGGIEYESDPESCTTESASICSTTTFYSVTIEPTATVTTFTSTSQTCATVFGCDVTNSDSATTVTSASDCPATPTSKPPNGCPQNAVVYPANPTSVGQIPTLLEKYASTYEVVGLPSFDFVSFYWVPLLDQQTMDTLKASSDVSDAYYYEDFYANVGYAPNEMDDQEEASLAFRDIMVRGPAYSHDMWLKNESAVGHSKTNVNLVGDMEDISPQSALSRRAGTAEIQKTNYFELSQISLAPGQVWKTGESNSGSISSILGFITSYNYLYDASAGAGQHTYILNEHLVWETHPEFTVNQVPSGTVNPNIEHVAPQLFGPVPNQPLPAGDTYTHGSAVGSKIIGNQLGVCKSCTMGWFIDQSVAQGQPGYYYFRPEIALTQLMTAAQHMIDNNRLGGTAVINLSMSIRNPFVSAGYLGAWYSSLQLLDSKLKAVLVLSSGNDATPTNNEITNYPAKFLDPNDPQIIQLGGPLSNLIVVGATDIDTYMSEFSQYSDYMTTFAPGDTIWAPLNPTGGIQQDDMYGAPNQGTSFSAPLVAGLAAYFRGLPMPAGKTWGTQLQEPANVKRLIVLFHRRIAGIRNPSRGKAWSAAATRPIIWNGQVWSVMKQRSFSCIADYLTISTWDENNACPTIPDDLTTLPLSGNVALSCGGGGTVPTNPKAKRQSAAGGTCLLDPGAGGGQSIGFTSSPSSVPPAPTCAVPAGCGGTLCTGYYCNPNPTGNPPGFYDPKDPNAGNPITATTTTTTTTTSSTTTAVSPPTPTNQISIFYSFGCDDTTCYANWYVYATSVGGTVDVCDYFLNGPDPLAQATAPQLGSSNYPPNATTQLGSFTDGSYTDCTYSGTTNGGGTFTCSGFPAPVPCNNFVGSNICTTCSDGEGADEYCAEQYCQW